MKKTSAAVASLVWLALVVVGLAAKSDASSRDIFSIKDGDVSFLLTGASETLAIQGNSDLLTFEYATDGVTVEGEISGLTGDLLIRGRRGDDTILLFDLDVPGDLKIVADQGDDTVLFANLDLGRTEPPTVVGGDLSINTGTGDDEVRILQPVTVAGNVKVTTGRDDDEVVLGSTDRGGSPQTLSVGHDMIVSTGSGADRLRSCCVSVGNDLRVGMGTEGDVLSFGSRGPLGTGLPFSVGDDLSISTGSGPDDVTASFLTVEDDTRVSTGPGADQVSLEFLRRSVERVVVDTGSENDLVKIDLSSPRGETVIKTRSGDDDIVISSVDMTNPLTAHLGTGNDHLAIRSSTVGDLTVLAEEGNDVVDLVPEVRTRGDVVLDGGPGLEDRLIRDATTTHDLPPTITGFEPSNTGCIIEAQPVDTVVTGPECEALVDLYNSTDGPNWLNNDGWNTPTDPCGWHGITCESSELRILDLSSNQLSGPMPATLGRLTNLVELSLFFNRLSDSIPAELGQLTNLQELHLWENQLSGPIPAELGQLTDLHNLQLMFNRLSGPIPPELGQLENLERLFLWGNQLSGAIPAELGQLANLGQLELYSNQLSGSIPAELGQMTNLTSFNVSFNQLSGPIPPELGQLANLELLAADGNQLSGPIPPELGQLTTVDNISLSDNQLSGPIPPELGRLANLGSLVLNSNQLSGDITDAMAGLRVNGAIQQILLSDGVGGNDCLTVTDLTLPSWIAAFDADWDECSTSGALPTTGTVVPELAAFDQAMLDYMAERGIEGGLLAVMKDGVVVLERGYGWKDEAHTTPIQPDSLMRIASVTKPITAAAIQTLIARGDLASSDRVFCLDGASTGCVLDIEPFGTPDSRLQDVTVQHLLDHRGGWDRGLSGDPMFDARGIAATLGVSSPPGQEDFARYMMGRPLDHTPGSTFAYSNFGYLLLGLVVEEVTAQDYTAFLQDEIFAPLGVASTEVELGATLPTDRNPREPWYDSPYVGPSVYPPHELVPWPDGGWALEAFEAHGGLIATPRALLEFAQAYWFSGLPRNNDGQNWYAIGSLDGTYSMLRWRPDGINIAFIVNSRDGGPSPLEIKDDLDAAADSIGQWP